MSHPPTHVGGCHCGAVRFRTKVDLAKTLVCNCSICSKRGHILSFVPAEQFELVSGEEKLTDYRFNKMTINHQFCSICGVGAFARGEAPDGTTMVAINVRCIDEVEIEALAPTHFDGRSL